MERGRNWHDSKQPYYLVFHRCDKTILIESMYIVFVPFDWTWALSPVCFWSVLQRARTTYLCNQCEQHENTTVTVSDWVIEDTYIYNTIKLTSYQNNMWTSSDFLSCAHPAHITLSLQLMSKLVNTLLDSS
jgi:hypothetical protein